MTPERLTKLKGRALEIFDDLEDAVRWLTRETEQLKQALAYERDEAAQEKAARERDQEAFQRILDANILADACREARARLEADE